jgi:hypothetical protein
MSTTDNNNACTGHVGTDGLLRHDGDTCPIHEDNTPAPLGWVIDRDHINTTPDDVPSRVGLGARIDDRVRLPLLQRGLKVSDIADPVRFRVLDDDGVVYYGGAIDRSWIDGDEEYAFNPLTWATHDAGATELQYRAPDGTWITL